MKRGYWLPANAEHLAGCDGFYVDSSAVYHGNMETCWDNFLDTLCQKMAAKKPTLQKYCGWKQYTGGRSGFVILYDRYVDLIVEDVEEYVAVYLIIPESCKTPGYAKRAFPGYFKALQEVLTELYPGTVRKRLNSQHTTLVGKAK